MGEAVISLKCFLWISLLCLLVFFPQVTSIRCYDCNSRDHGCDKIDGSDEKHLVNCSLEGLHIGCRKMIKRVYENNTEISQTIVRGCAKEIKQDVKGCYSGTTLQISATKKETQEICECDTDKCNDTNQPTLSVVLKFTTLIVATFIAFFLS